MEAEEVLKMYDLYWFEHKVLNEIPSPRKNSSSSQNPDCQIEEESSEAKLSRMQSITRSMSDQLSSMAASFDHESLSPQSVLFPPKLQTILSGEEVTETEAENEAQKHHLPSKNIASRRRRKKRESKSLSELEFEEVKGFMDLGFVFSEEDKDSSLASIIPGLQRLGKNDDEQRDSGKYSAVSRPYLSEAWEVLEDKQNKQNTLMNWTIPAMNNEVDMKESLRWWAHMVASTVR